MKYLDTILEQLRDAEWHNIREIKEKVCLPDDKLSGLLSFLEEQAFINKDGSRIKITLFGLKFLELPS